CSGCPESQILEEAVAVKRLVSLSSPFTACRQKREPLRPQEKKSSTRPGVHRQRRKWRSAKGGVFPIRWKAQGKGAVIALQIANRFGRCPAGQYSLLSLPAGMTCIPYADTAKDKKNE
ncbi:unnamed protein product, partial [Ectocarpus sp. 12 AP-2014]